ncbi:MAG: VWA domain-containing protein [Candidatus Eremiobacteraeota bacterium]|nr:VWA domain-containing protein [Candidatus Eremiobacteraeota bacterium]MBC5804511.1 VWA domain-containing protein [Candidatus Eremiobacteraeota bacterium]MBC5820419.1 VWA domain-containing protein [Candidatus Eremiobacteraeota bacterium]
MTFARPLGLAIALVAAALFVWLYLTIERRSRAQALAYSDLAFALDALRPARWPAALILTAYACGCAVLALALGGPHFLARVPTHDGTVVLCIDTSGSMRATDLAPTRADAAKAAARAFVDAVPAGTRIGIVSFSSGANAILAPTDDRDAVHEALARIPPPDGATAIGDALAVAAQGMPSRGRRIIVLLTDGINNRGADPIAVSQNLGQHGIRIETVGVGSSGSGELIPGTSEQADLDASALETIAQNGAGRYVAASDAASLRDAFRGLAFETVWEKRRVDGSLPFALGGGALLLATLLGGFALGKFP